MSDVFMSDVLIRLFGLQEHPSPEKALTLECCPVPVPGPFTFPALPSPNARHIRVPDWAANAQDAGGHSLMSPSARERWSVCPGSVKSSIGLSSPATAASEFGVKCHIAFSEVVSGKKEIIEYSRDVADVIECAVEYVSGYTSGTDTRVWSEYYLDSSHVMGHDLCSGTADVIIARRGKPLIVADLKTGNPSLASARKQLGVYAVMAISGLTNPFGADAVELVVLTRHTSVCVGQLSASDVLAEKEEIAKSVERCLVEEPVYVPDKGACRFCPAKNYCTSYLFGG